MEKKEILGFIESKGFNKTLWREAGKAMHCYNMIKDGDRIAVGISGGKDSLTLFNLLLRVKMISNVNFEIVPVFVDQNGSEGKDAERVKNYIEELGYSLIIENSNIEKIVFDERKEKNPCALCSRMRRGILYRIMKEQNCNKLALGHHLDDMIETFLMNLFYQGSTRKMEPMYRSEEYGIDVIRPLAFVEEETIIKYTRKIGAPIMGCNCRLYQIKMDPKRLETKILIKNLEKKNPEIRKSIKNALMGEAEANREDSF